MDFREENVICRFCLKKLTENCEPIEEMIQHALNFLNLCPDLTISDDPMMCETCAANLKKCFDFKGKCLATEDCIASFVEGEDKKVDIRDIYSKVKLDGNINTIPEDLSVCRFCLELVKDNNSTSVRNDVNVIQILQKYFLEMDLRITDDIIACAPCYNCLQFHVSFINNYESIEEKINEYYQVEGANYKAQVDLKDVATFMSKGMLNFENISSLIIKEEKLDIVDNKVGLQVKFEDTMAEEQEKEKLSDEEVELKYNDSFQAYSSPPQSDCVKQLTTAKPAKYTCEICDYQTNRRYRLQEHILTHKDTVQDASYNCEICPFKTTKKDYLRKHTLRHKHTNTTDEVTQCTKHECELCDYDTKWKSDLKRHMRSHKTDSEGTVFKCDLCDYETKCKFDLKSHILTHKTQSELTVYKCSHCDFKAKGMFNLKRHMRSHKTHPQVIVYKCALCNYQAKWKNSLNRHMMTHKTTSEINTYKCNICDYEAKRKADLMRHMLTHKPRSETTMYKCESCDYVTKYKDNLHKHKRTHMDASEIEIHKCQVCPFTTKWKWNFQKHIRGHRDIPDVAT